MTRTPATILDPIITRYLKHFRTLGRCFDSEERTLRSLSSFLIRKNKRDLDAALFDDWCHTFETLSANFRRMRQRIVRNFCLYRRRTESRCFVPDLHRFVRPQPYPAPIILTQAQIAQLLEFAGEYQSTPQTPFLPQILRIAIVLLYTAGIRRGELVRLTLADVDAQAGILRVQESKFHKSRLIPLSSDARRELRRYLKQRLVSTLNTTPRSSLLFNLSRGQRGYTGAGLRAAIRRILLRGSIRDAEGRLPRIHDFRHTFAVHALLRWYRQGADVQSNLPKLALYMGHVSIVSTAYYLRWIPEIQELASARFAEHFAYLIQGEKS
jgi:integrase/recombinase XerD